MISLLQKRWQQLPESVVRKAQADRFAYYLRNLVLPFSAYYRDLFDQHDLDANEVHSLDDLQKLPFTSKADLLNTPEHPERFKEFILIPDKAKLARRPSTLWRSLLHGPAAVRKGFESEFRPVFSTFTTGRSADPTPFFY